MNLGQLAEGKEELEKALAARIDLFGAEQSDTLRNGVLLALCELRRGEREAAAGRIARIEPLAATMSRSAQRELQQMRALLRGEEGDVAGAVQGLSEAEGQAAAAGLPKAKLALGRLLRAELLVNRGDEWQREEGRALARELLEELTPLLVREAPALAKLRALIAAPGAR
jgi:hypothetical protein